MSDDLVYDRPASDAWVHPEHKDYRMACCDCALVHSVDFRIVDVFGEVVTGYDVQFRARRDPEQTLCQRRARETSLMAWWISLGRKLFPGLASITPK